MRECEYIFIRVIIDCAVRLLRHARPSGDSPLKTTELSFCAKIIHRVINRSRKKLIRSLSILSVKEEREHPRHEVLYEHVISLLHNEISLNERTYMTNRACNRPREKYLSVEEIDIAILPLPPPFDIRYVN